ncbi:uncharacterized protein LOC110380974 isoform X1 [Helicoverpa armigera]|uniref:Uncharacterized protein n=2 Tax=Helicoverpa armigera TaxID=29058 RepID=A0A2W1BH18_HELAM|nr:uncharacterized protein LOC110380974 isoform X1 [Helicoverpa armigera]XP_049703241.1 uncharacterized protein LOC126053446 isoform X1 [Helicoverpa armigera]XP_049703242.1 uncharacterized protein LOC126053446 isoform X1 [Helicoverpa armigera]PZC73015.1 hypothetical protein B5X24_HaOG210186 [Helicoverpa armigera]
MLRIPPFLFIAAMEKPARYKSKNKKPAAKAKTSKKRKSDGPTCSMFLAELTRKLASKKKQEEEEEHSPRNIVQTIIDSITNALPVKISRKSPQKIPSPMKMETLQTFAPELIPNDILNIPPPNPPSPPVPPINDDVSMEEVEIAVQKPGTFKMPKMPLVSSEVLKMAVIERKKKIPMQDQAVNTGTEHDVATEIAKHVSTLRKISLIAEEFNQKTAKNLKEIVDSVQEDLIKKLEQIQAEKRAASDRTFHLETESEDRDD